MAKTEVKSTQIKQLTILVEDLSDFGPTDGGSLNLNIKAGRLRDDNTITDKSAQVVALTDSTTNFVELDNLGVATKNTSAFTSGSTPIAQVVTSGGSISSITDKRTWIIGALAGGGGGLSGVGLSTIEIVQKTSDETVNNSTTLQDDDALKVALAANETIYFIFNILFNTSSSADWAMAYTIPSGATLHWTPPASVGIGDNGAANTFVTRTASGSDDSRGGSGATNLDTAVGVVVNGSTPGDLQLQWAQKTAEASDTKVLANSFIIVWRK